jgi:hypothetical protein
MIYKPSEAKRRELKTTEAKKTREAYGFVSHGRDVGAACCARAHNDSDLGNALRGHGGLVEENTAKVVLVGEDVVLTGQIGASGIDQINTRQAVLLGDFLSSEVLLYGDGVIRSALHSRVVGDNDTFHTEEGKEERKQRRVN